jgi:purine-binding chemotaxis protein CheW
MNETNTEKESINTYLSFNLGDEIFAANVKKVINILEMQPITKVPQSPAYMKGVINLRGSVLPVVDLRIKFGLPETEVTKDTCIIVLKIELDGEKVLVGALVDAVREVIEIDLNKSESAPSIGTKYKANFIHGMWKHKDGFIMLLNIDMVFTQDDILNVKEAQESTSEQVI